MDFGTAASSGGNKVTVPQFSCIADFRPDRAAANGVIWSLVGTTLNGATLSGLVTGPASSTPYYQVGVNNRLQF
jgi:hypothetical protein